jgi:hypothetical protein
MITEEQYLEAKKIVDAYNLQLKQARVSGSFCCGAKTLPINMYNYRFCLICGKKHYPTK